MVFSKWRVRITRVVGVVGCISAVSGLGAQPADAAILNGGFENGFQGWELACFDACDTEVPSNYATTGTDPIAGGPVQGSAQARIRATAVNAADVEKFLGLTSGKLSQLGNGAAIAGSAIRQTFTAKAGSTLSFNFNFIGDDDLPYNDFSVFSFYSFNSNSALAVKLSQIADLPNSDPSDPNYPFRVSGYQKYSFKVPTTGTFTVGFASLNAIDNASQPTLLVDNVRLNSPAIPTPALLPGLMGLGLGAWRQRRVKLAEKSEETR